jgi:hypothetical protein
LLISKSQELVTAQLQAKKVAVPLMCLLVVNQVAHGILESRIIQLESGICHHSLSFLKKMKSQGGNYSNLVQIRILISKQGCWFLLSFCMHVNIFLKPAADISKPKQLIMFTQISRISMMPPLVGHWDSAGTTV